MRKFFPASAERVAGICTVFAFVFLAMMWALVLFSLSRSSRGLDKSELRQG